MEGKDVVILDTFLFHNELDLLELRLRLLYDYVDKFVIMEFGTTHAGLQKPINFVLNHERFAWADKKIIYILSDGEFEYEKTFDIYNGQRKALYDSVVKIASKEDIILISDIDEIPSRKFVANLRNDIPSPLLATQDLYFYNINCPRNQKWYGTMATKRDFHANVTDKGRPDMEKTTYNAGWHFSYFMTPEQIKEKLIAFGHHKDYGKPPYTDKDYIVKCIAENKNFIKADNPKRFVEASPLPEYLMDEMKRFPVFMGQYE